MTGKEVLRELVLKYNVPQNVLEPLRLLDKRDTPMKVDKVDITPLACYYYYCKACHVSQGSSEVDRSDKHFCYNCGQRLDWSNE